ncbi:PLC-like phosphodiesterase [Biscogniauxia mediterranea]|nr:PLC-like phosphodiesterase [Biscogniauxia mediterranea]
MRRVILPLLALAGTTTAVDCNGHAELCSRAYSDVTFAGSHNAPFVGVGPSDNQLTSVTDQLNQGIRFLQAQTHDKDGAIQMCHTSCVLRDAGTLQDYLSGIKTWVDANTNEVLTLLITNGDAIDITKFGDAFTSTGLEQYVYTPPSSELALDAWPTLGNLISSGKRVIVFMDYNSDQSKVPYILNEFAYYFETPFDPTEDILESQCNIDRPSGASADGRMFLVNHNRNVELFPDVLIPDLVNAASTNSIDSITAQTNICSSSYGRNPNVVLLDWVLIGDAIAAQDKLNGF